MTPPPRDRSRQFPRRLRRPAFEIRLLLLALAGGVELWVEDGGPGLSNPENLFVPFYTTKPQGTGIGLVLSRQIAEAHGGTVTLEERPSGSGVLARLRLASATPSSRLGEAS